MRTKEEQEAYEKKVIAENLKEANEQDRLENENSNLNFALHAFIFILFVVICIIVNKLYF